MGSFFNFGCPTGDEIFKHSSTFSYHHISSNIIPSYRVISAIFSLIHISSSAHFFPFCDQVHHWFFCCLQGRIFSHSPMFVSPPYVFVFCVRMAFTLLHVDPLQVLSGMYYMHLISQRWWENNRHVKCKQFCLLQCCHCMCTCEPFWHYLDRVFPA